MKIVTSGYSFIDIDAYGGCVGYAELLKQQGQDARAVSTAPLNVSITEHLRALKVPFHTSYTSNNADTFILIDISNPEFFEKFVDLEQVERVIDHHAGFEAFWEERLGRAATIEFIGAACTLVVEAWETAGLTRKMSQASAELLAAGIIDNTLNFKSALTTNRDKEAYHLLAQHAGLDDAWRQAYLEEYQTAQSADLGATIRNDYKLLSPSPFLPPLMAQLVLWSGGAENFIAENRSSIESVLNPVRPKWWMNIISVEDGASYYIASDPEEEKRFGDLMHAPFYDGVAKAERLVLRKEILKAAETASQK